MQDFSAYLEYLFPLMQLKNILDESALGTQSIDASSSDTNGASQATVQTAINNIQQKVDAIIDGTLSCSWSPNYKTKISTNLSVYLSDQKLHKSPRIKSKAKTTALYE